MSSGSLIEVSAFSATDYIVGFFPTMIEVFSKLGRDMNSGPPKDFSGCPRPVSAPRS